MHGKIPIPNRFEKKNKVYVSFQTIFENRKSAFFINGNLQYQFGYVRLVLTKYFQKCIADQNSNSPNGRKSSKDNKLCVG